MSEKQRYTGSPSLSVKKSRRREESVHALSPSFFLSFRKVFVNLGRRRGRGIFIVPNLGEPPRERNSLARERRHFGRLWQFLSYGATSVPCRGPRTIDLNRYVNAYGGSLCQIGWSGAIPVRRRCAPCVTWYVSQDKFAGVSPAIDLDILLDTSVVYYCYVFAEIYTYRLINSVTINTVYIIDCVNFEKRIL